MTWWKGKLWSFVDADGKLGWGMGDANNPDDIPDEEEKPDSMRPYGGQYACGANGSDALKWAFAIMNEPLEIPEDDGEEHSDVIVHRLGEKTFVLHPQPDVHVALSPEAIDEALAKEAAEEPEVPTSGRSAAPATTESTTEGAPSGSSASSTSPETPGPAEHPPQDAA